MAVDIEKMQAITGRMLKEDNTTVNVADLLSDRNSILFRGRVDWTLDQDVLGVLDIPLPTVQSEQYLLTVVNGSPDVDLTVKIGNMIRAIGASTVAMQSARACTAVAATDIFTLVGHGFVVGQAVEFAGVTGGNMVAGATYYVIAANLAANTFQVSTTRGGSTIDVGAADVASLTTVIVADEFALHSSFTVEKFAAATSTVPVAGAKCYLISGWPNGETGRLLIAKSAATAAAFSAFVELRRA